MPTAGWIIAIVGTVLWLLALLDLFRSGWPPSPRARAWMLTGTIFAVVVLYLVGRSIVGS